MIRRITPRDHDELRALWQDCFPNDDGFFELTRDACGYMMIDQKPVSMLFFEPTHLVCEGRSFSAIYLYGVGTRSDCRGRGYARRLILHAISEQDAALALIVPARPELFGFYEKMGFITAFYNEKITARSTGCEPDGLSVRPIGGDAEFLACNSLYRSATRLRFAPERSLEKWEFSTRVASVFGGGILGCFDGGALCGYAVFEACEITELICRGERVYNTLVAACLSRMGRDTAPLYAPACPKNARPFGMARLCGTERLLDGLLPDLDLSIYDSDIVSNSGKFNICNGKARRVSDCSAATITAQDVVKTILSGGLPPYLNLVYS